MGAGFSAMPLPDVQAAKKETTTKVKKETKTNNKKEKDSSSKKSSKPSSSVTRSPDPETVTAKTLAGTKPNIILILTDDQTFDSVSKMPYLSSRSDWIKFTNAYLETSLCCPSRATLLTGQYDTHTGVLHIYDENNGEQLDESQTLAVWLKAAGYKTALLGKYLNQYPWDRGNYIPPGWDKWFAFSRILGPTRHYFEYTINDNGKTKKFGSKSEDYSTDVLATQAVRFIRDVKQPFFLYLSVYAPHKPFLAAPRDKGAYKDAHVNLDPNFNEDNVSDKPEFIQALPKLDVSQQKANTRHQWEALLAVDDAIKSIVKELEDKKILEKTVIIFMTDNGYAHGEHRWVGKRCPYDVCMRTPLLVYYPGKGGGKIENLVGNFDIAPTIVELAGAKAGIGQDGVSLVPLIEGKATSWRDAILGHWGGGGFVSPSNPPNFWSVRTSNYRYTEYDTGEKELYDYSVDPYELNNKINQSSYAAVQSSLVRKLAALKAQALAPAKGPNGSVPATQDSKNKTFILDTEDDE
jgi:arylsulfatase A-like enzyme